MVSLTPTTVAIIVLVLLIVGGALGMVFARRQRIVRLHKQFGPEYDRALQELGDEREVEKMLSSRVDHVRSLEIRTLSKDEAEHFNTEWHAAQAQFVDEPLAAVKRANRLIREAMSTRGYPVDDFEQRAADISVDYPELVEDYRSLHALAAKSEKTQLDTEEMRQAMLHARSLFDELVKEDVSEQISRKETV